MPLPPDHQCQVLGSPWQGVYGTQISSARHYGKHWHGVYGLGLMDEGAQTSASGRGKVEAYAGDLIATNPGEVHDGQPLGRPSRRWRMVYIEPAVLAGLAQELAHDHQRQAGLRAASAIAVVQPVFRSGSLRQTLLGLLAGLQDWARHPGGAEVLACEEALAQTCAGLLLRHSSVVPGNAVAGRTAGKSADPGVARARDCLAADLLAPPSLAVLAHTAGLSRFQLLRQFACSYGITPHAWLMQQRAERARSLIHRGAALAQAAADSGFADQSHMTRIFSRQFGFTPGAWQQASGSGLRQLARLQ